MATSPGISWSLSIQPLLTASYSSLNKSILPDLSNSIIASERDILNHDDEYEPFYSSFVALASHYLSSSAGDVAKPNLQTISGACKVLLQFMLQRLQTQNESCTISAKYLMILIKGICTGHSSLPKADIVTFTAMMKSARPPQNIRDKENEADEVEPKEPKRTRLDTETNIFDQMTSVFDEIAPQQTTTKVEPVTETVTAEDDITIVHIPQDSSQEMKALFGKRNLASLSQLNGGNILVDVCLELTFLKRYIQGYKDALSGGPFAMPSTLSEALTTRNSFQQLLSNISIVWRVVSLPILEPLTVKRLEKIITMTMGCLYASVSVATTNTIISLASGTPTKGTTGGKEEDTDSYAANIVQKTLEIYSSVSTAIHTSTRAGGNIAQNLNLLSTWLLLQGLQGILTLTPAMILERKDSRSKATGETPQKPREGQPSRPSSGKSSFQGLDVLSVALGLQGLQLLHKLFVDLQIEGVMPNIGASIQQQVNPESRPVLDVAILAPLPAWKRVQKLMAVISLPDLMFSLAPAAFKKACFLQKLKQGSETSETSSSSASDSNTFYEDDFSSSDDSSDEDDEDSEPILGHFMVEIMSPSSESKDPDPPPPLPSRFGEDSSNKRSRKVSSSDSPSMIPDKREPDGFISLSAGILQFLNTYFISSSDEVLQMFIQDSLTEEHMTSLALLIKDMDRECAKLGKGQDKVFEELSISLSRFNHSLVASSCLSDKLQDTLLSQLGISLNSGDHWPLSVFPRSLAVLAEILLLRQQREREAKKMISQSETAVVNIWLRFMETLSRNIMKMDSKPDPNEDVNVEHLQLLLFLFHSLPLMQKKALLLQLAQNIIRVTSADQKVLLETTPSSLCRLMLILDYLLHNFYDPPQELVDQVQWNLFTVHTLNRAPEENVPMSKHSIWFPCQEVEDNFRKYLTPQELLEVGILTPRFYSLGPTGINTQEAPKVDGLACSFLLSNAEQLDYGEFYKSCITLLLAGTAVDKAKPKLSLLDACTIQYHFTIMWRLLACLPPSIRYLRSLESGTLDMEHAELLHTLRWAPRLGQKAFMGWIKDAVVKQGLTTQQAEALLTAANKTTNCLNYDIRLAMNFIQDQIGALPLINQRDLVPVSELPGLTVVLLMDAVTAKLQVALDEAFTKAMSEIDPHSSMNVAQDLIPASLLLVEAYSVYVRSCMLSQLSEGSESQPMSPRQLRAISTVMSIASHSIPKMYVLGSGVISSLPSPIKTVVEGWTDKKASEFPELGSWQTDYSKDIIPVESYIEVIQRAHITQLSDGKYNISLSMKHVLNSLCRLATDLVIWCDANSSKDMVRVLFPMMFDATTEHLATTLTTYLERFLGQRDGEQFSEKMYEHIVRVCHELLLEYSDEESGLDEKILTDCLKFLELSLEKPLFLKAFEKIYLENTDLTSLLLSSARENLSPQFACKVLKFFNKLLQLADGNGKNAKTYKELCKSLCKLADVDRCTLQFWLSKMIVIAKEEDKDSITESRQLLKTFSLYLVKENGPVSESVSQAILSALIPLGDVLLPTPTSETNGFPELMVVMQILAGVGHGLGHTRLFAAATKWLTDCKVQVIKKDVVEKVLKNGQSGKNIMNTLCCLLFYIGEILGALKKNTDRSGAVSPPLEHEVTFTQEPDSDWGEDITQEDDDSAGEDSDEESLNNKLCTFTITQKEFMNQHWYHCHTCKMVDGVGVCTVCAKVCHKDHDLTYAKFGSFFCDCGAKEDGSCKSLVKRTVQSGINSTEQVAMPSPFSMETNLPSSLRRRMSSPNQSEKTSDKAAEQSSKAREVLCRQIEGSREDLLNTVTSSGTVETVLEILDNILPTLTENYQNMSPTGSLRRAQAALEKLHKEVKSTETTDQLMAVTLGSQEGAFENVRMSYSGDQGQQIRQLITAHMLRRVAMCVLASPQGKRQHLAVSHEKGKITILQLSALLKQADSSKKKLTLTRLASAPIPFTVLSITGNPCNEDYLAVCGLKDCHVLTFSSSGSVADHLVLHPTLATGNFIIKALWLPGTQTELAIVTADFVKIYNLSADAVSPQYFFLLPSGKIRDVSFVFSEEGRYIVLMSSAGYIYTEAMDESSSASHGPFYITNVIEVKHNDLKDVNGQVAGGGLSVYYSHVLQLLFFSYTQGKNLCASIEKDLSSTITVFPITFKSNGSAKGGNSSQPLVQWSEVPGHTGLLYCMTQTSNNPVVLMIQPDAILVQEIKVVPAKAKIQDVVAIRHNASNSDQQRTTMILLCEDGSLRIYMANVDKTNYWLSPYLQPQSPISVLKPVKKKKVTKSGRPTGSVNFPIDFFEHCLQSNDIEFGGNDILQIYNVQQVKHRLNTTGMYIASTKPAGFSIEITKTTNTTVMVGVRVLVGSQSIDRAPTYLEVFGRTTAVNCTRPRWVDMPFTREESLGADKKFTLFVGTSTDPNGVTMVDSIKVFTKTKEAFGWPEEPDEFQEQSTPKPAAVVAANSANNNNENEVVQPSASSFTPLPLTSADKLLSSALEVLDGAFAASLTEEKEPSRQKTLEIATSLLTLATPSSVQQHTKSLMASLFANSQIYHTHKDQAQLGAVMKCLSKDRESDAADVEGFQRLVVTARSVAVARPANLVKFADKETGKDEVLEVTDLETEKEEPHVAVGELEPHERCHFVTHLMETFWKLLASRPPNPMLAPVCLPGLAHADATVGALVEIIHAFTLADLENVPLACKHYTKLLMAQESAVSFACKQAMIRCLRPRSRRKRVYIPSPPRCSSPGGGDDDDDEDDQPKGDQPDSTIQSINIAENQNREPENDNDIEPYEIVEGSEPMVLEPPEPPGARMPFEQLLQAGGSFPPVVDIPPDADDETMVELAIALSLQDQSGGAIGLQGLRLASNAQNAASFEECHLSDTTASAPGSDDEMGSNAATDGSTLRTSPADHAGSGGSDSAGSAEESMLGDPNVSGRSSMYGDRDRGGRSETSSVGVPSTSLPPEGDMIEPDHDATTRLHSLRLMLLERLIQYLPEVSSRGGVPAIPFMQVVLMLTSDLDAEEEKDRAALDALLNALLKELDLSGKELDSIACRSKEFEVKLVYLRLLSVLLSRTKAGTKPSTESSSFISNTAANALLMSGAIQYCLTILKNLLPYWRNYNPTEEETSPLPGQLLKPHPQGSAPDMSPFFLRQYVKGHANDVFEDYPQLLTEMVLRLPYQLKKIGDSVPSVSSATFDQAWHTVLSEYMMTQQTPFVKKQVRKLLLFICGSKDKYRQLRDLHAIDSHLQAVVEQCKKGGLDTVEVTPHSIILPYDSLLTLIEHLKVCSDIATSRPVNWQKYCQNNEGIVPFLVKASISLDEGVAPTLLQLLQCALCGSEVTKGPQPSGAATGTSPAKQKKAKDKDKDKDKNEDSDDGQKHDDSLCVSLIQLLNKTLDRALLTHFVRTFLLESNATSIRWQAHSLVHQIYKNSSLSEQEGLMELMWVLWQELPLYGRKAAQFVDLLGYFVLKTPQTSEKKTKEYLEKAISVLKDENKILANHPNAQIYNMLQGLVDFDGYYLESDPCLVCNNPEVPYTSLKLTNIKVDSKFTTTTQIVKLVGSYNISKISLRITDLKRTKMVRVMSIYYNNRTVQAVVELKNKPGLWHKARKMTLTAGQTDVKIEFPIPIVACNIMIEYSDFYDNLQATSETLQCPRCSASVPANPGVCGNCGENVFQCHKCRAINYDEKDPFLCNACGFCKYAKFDFTLTAKPCCAVDPIENEDDRQKAISTINSLLEKADRIYKQLQCHRPALENLMIQVADHSMDRPEDGASGGPGGGVPGSTVNKAIQHLALQYCGESKSSFDELSKIIQKVLACRRELVDYDRQQRQVVAATSSPVTSPRDPPLMKAVEVLSCASKKDKSASKPSTCYGCASSAVEHCITLLRALVTNTNLRQILCSQGMIQELIDFNLRRGTLQVRSEVRSLLCLLTKDSRRGTEEMNNIIMTRIASAVKGHLSNPYLGSSVRHEILLLGSSLKQQDSCWELRVRCVMRLFLMGMQMKQPLIMESVTLPCLRILQFLMAPEKPAAKVQNEDGSQEGKEESAPSLLTALSSDLHGDGRKWLQGDPKYSFQNWKKCLPKQGQRPQSAEAEAKEGEKKEKEEKKLVRARYLMEKYATRWQQRMLKLPTVHLKLVQSTWLQQAMFSRSSLSARQTATKIIEDIAQVPARKKEIIDMLTGCLDLVGKNGEYSLEYLKLYQRLIVQEQWKYYLAIKGVLLKLGDLITQEVEKLQSLEETTLNSDLAQGFALKAFTELLALLVQQKEIKQHYKNRLVGYVLNGYLSLKKLLVQRTKLIDETQDKLLELLEDLTTGTESETKEFMQVCVQTIKKYPLDDQVSPVFIFERLCSIIFPEENDVGEFFMILEKDPQQEDFLQGRMLGNPYSSNEVGLGPLMRDVKNKICQDCELVALLEDDTGMELLVNKKIISLDLPVKDVYKKVWAPEHGEGEPMQVIYRMRGLLGDATEDMVNSLDSNTQEDVDKEEVFRMANVLSTCDGLQVMLARLESIKDLVLGKPLMLVLLKLFGFAVNVKANRQQLIKPEMNTITVMLRALNLALWAEQESGTTATKGQTITEQILQIMETILIEASSQSPDAYTEFSKLCGDTEQLMMLLERINSPFVRANSSVLQALMRLIPFLAFGEEDKMLTLINHFKPYLEFNKFDTEHSQDEKVHLDCFCTIASAIENNENGIRLKDMIVEQGLVKMALDYIMTHAPEVKTLLATDSEIWKDFLAKPALNYILRLLTGISNGHTPTQLELGNHLIPILHKLEQVSSDKHIGTMAENLMEALKTNPVVAAKIEDVRQQTKTEKKRLAMAVRKKHLGALGMTTNAKGQVTVSSAVLKQMEDIKEETGLTCCICREGYRYQPQKVLAIYTFTKRSNLDEYENKQRKTVGFYTVSHFNVIHVDCHTAAVRLARGREEWESAALQNANTKCNGLLPLWGPQVQESAFATCLARHNTYLQECTGVRDPSYPFTIHDLKMLLLRFAEEKSFSDESGGGGKQSNIHVLAYIMHMALYVINTTRSASREEKNLSNFLETPKDRWLENAFETEGPLYYAVMALHIMPPEKWKAQRVKFLERLFVLAHIRNTVAIGGTTITDKSMKDYIVYKPYLVFFGLVNGLYTSVFKKVVIAENDWSKSLADFIRNNDKPIIEACDKLLGVYQDEMMPCESFAEFCDVVGLLEDIPNPDTFVTELLSSLP